MRTRRLLSVFALLLFLQGFGALSAPIAQALDLPEGVPENAQEAEVTGHIDGDKFNVEIDGKREVVLLISADAPEPAGDGDDLGECYAKESSDRLKKLIPKGTTVYLEQDSDDRDGKDRLLRYVWLPREGKKAQFIDERMVADGYSTFTPRDGNDRRNERMERAEQIAKDENRGLWEHCGGGHVDITPVPALGSGDNPAPLGTPVEADGRRITVNSAYFTETYGFFAPQQNYVFLVIDVTMENISESGKTHAYNELCFAAKDLDRDADYDDSFLNPSDRPFGSGDMLPGDVVGGEVVLEVHQDSQRIRVKYSTGPGCIGGKSVYWLVVR
jgi:endonuclease YncB( thermonuclease family)